RWLNGDFVWVRSAGGPGDDSTNSLAADYGGVSAAGQYTGTANFATGPATYNLFDSGQGSGSLWRLDTNGSLLVARGLGCAQTTQALGIGIGLAGYTFVGGRFRGTVDFDQGFGGSFTMTSAGGDDGFVAKFQDFLDMAPIARDDAFAVQAGHTL